ncbi:MAG: preprotein translocase subunit SecG [Opitutales bacterium]|nr:preprotein translocase subunit SecG [Opitutales bacterium]
MITFFTTFLILVCLVVVLLIMIQRTSGGMGSALGGGAADQVLGAGSAAQLTKMTVWGILGFFILSFALYALYQSEAGESEELKRLGTGTPVLQPNIIPPVTENAPAEAIAAEPSVAVDEPVVPAVKETPVVSDSVSEANSSN